MHLRRPKARYRRSSAHDRNDRSDPTRADVGRSGAALPHRPRGGRAAARRGRFPTMHVLARRLPGNDGALGRGQRVCSTDWSHSATMWACWPKSTIRSESGKSATSRKRSRTSHWSTLPIICAGKEGRRAPVRARRIAARVRPPDVNQPGKPPPRAAPTLPAWSRVACVGRRSARRTR